MVDKTKQDLREKTLEELMVIANQTLSKSLKERFKLVSKEVERVTMLHIQQIRNLGIISGVVAPLSLTLFQVKIFEVNEFLLLLGFSILLINICLSEFFLYKILNLKNEKTLSGLRNYSVASSSAECIINIETPSMDNLDDIIDNMETNISSLNEFDKVLDLTPYNEAQLCEISKMKTSSKIMVCMFMLGIFLIILAIIINPIMHNLTAFQQ